MNLLFAPIRAYANYLVDMIDELAVTWVDIRYGVDIEEMLDTDTVVDGCGA